MNKILIAHPGKQHSMRLAAAVKTAGYDFKYCTTVYNTKKSFLMRTVIPLLSKGDIKKAEGRNSKELSDDDVVQFCELGGLILLLLYRIDKSKRIYNHFSDALKHRFGKKVAKYAQKNNFDMVIMYDSTATECYEQLYDNEPRIIRIIDHAQTPRNYLYKVYQELKPKCGAFWDTFKNARYLNDSTYGDEVLHEINLANYHIVASTFSKNALIDSGVDESRIFTIPYGVELDKFNPVKKNPTEKIKLLFVGEINQRKGMLQILEAAKRINDPMIEFHLVGYGRQFNEELYAPYDPYVTFHGPLYSSDLQKIYEESDVFLFPVMGEGYGLVVLEALASGLPVISSVNCVGCDIIKDSYNGFLIQPCDTETLIDKILWIKRHPEQVQLMSRNARKSVEGYSWEKYYSRVAEALQTIEKEN